MADPYGGPGDQNIHHRHGTADVIDGYEGSQSSSYLNYPPLRNDPSPSLSFYKSQTNVDSDKNGDVTIQLHTSRTPSPTPSEHAMLSRKGVIDWHKILHWKFWFRREWLWYYVIVGILLIIVILISVYDRQIVRWLQPTAEKIRDLPAGWLIPIAIFFVISFPPLFGHEILAILCGVVWGLWAGFAITAAGTFVGELGNYYAFKSCCRSRGEKLEKTDLQYACLARTVREGGFWIALVARYSAIPGHFTTAVFSTCGMGVLVFALAAFLSLPKQFVTVYIGVILEESGTGTETTRDKIISYSVLTITGIITCVAMWYIYKKMDEVKQDVVYDRRKARQAKLDRAQSLRGSSVFNPDESETNLPLNPGEDSVYQQWDPHGHAAGVSGDPRHSQTLHVPTPHRVGAGNVARIPTYRTEGGGGYSASGQRYESPSTSAYTSSSTSPQPVSPVHSPAMHRQESWDVTGQIGGEAYHLPTIQPHTPLSGGFVSAPLPGSAQNLPKQSSLQQAQEIALSTSAVPPALPPPPSSPRSRNPYSPPSSPTRHTGYPPTAASAGYTSPQHTSPTMTSGQYGAAVTASPTLQQYPTNMLANPRSPPQSPIQMPTQYGFASQAHPQVHPQVRIVSPLPQSPASPDRHQTLAHQITAGPPGAASLTSNVVELGMHVQEPTDSTAYFTPAHSRAPTANQAEGRFPDPIQTPPPEYRP